MWKIKNALRWEKGSVCRNEIYLPEEHTVDIFLNNNMVTSLACSPYHLEDLALGYLFLYGFIKSEEQAAIRIDIEEDIIRVKGTGFQNTDRAHEELSFSGEVVPSNICEASLPPVDRGEVRLEPEQVSCFMELLKNKSEKNPRHRAVHSAALFSGEEMSIFRQDIGRHNAIDKAIGNFWGAGGNFNDSVLVLSGRLTLEVVWKAARAGIPFIISRAGATAAAVELADKLNMTLVVYAREGRFDVLASAHRVSGISF